MVRTAVIDLFFIQLLTESIASNYAFGLLNNRFPPEAASVVLLLAPFVLAMRRRWPPCTATMLLGVIIVCRLALPLLTDTRLVMLISGAGVAALLLLMPLVLQQTPLPASSLVAGLLFAVTASVASRGISSRIDVTTSGMGQSLTWPLALWAFCCPRLPAASTLRVGSTTPSLHGDRSYRCRLCPEAGI